MGRSNILTKSERNITRKAIKDGKAKIFEKGTVLLVGIGTIGKVGIAGKDLSANQQITGMIFDSSITPSFAYYWLLNQQGNIKKASSTAILPIINQKKIKALPIVIPSHEEQKRIVAYLDKIQEALKYLKRLQQITERELKNIVPSILDKAFKGGL